MGGERVASSGQTPQPLNARLSSSAFGDGIVLQEAMDQQGVEEEEWERCELCAKYINAKLAKVRALRCAFEI